MADELDATSPTWDLSYEQIVQRFYAAHREKDAMVRRVNELGGQIWELRRQLSAKERQRSAIMFRRPTTAEGEARLEVLERQIEAMSQQKTDLEVVKADAEEKMFQAQRIMNSAKTIIDRETNGW